MKKYSKYIFVFILTLTIFGAAWITSTILNKKKFDNIKLAQDQAYIDILASETNFETSDDGNCDLSESDAIATNMNKLADKISYSEQNVSKRQEIISLKKQYTLLEIRDYLLNKRISERCNHDFHSVLYFYGTKVDCPDCVKQGYVLDALHQLNPDIRIYAFDYNLDLITIKALKKTYNIEDVVPSLVINGKTYKGFQSIDSLSAIFSSLSQ